MICIYIHENEVKIMIFAFSQKILEIQGVAIYAYKCLSELTSARHFRKFHQNTNFGIVKTSSCARRERKSKKLQMLLFPKEY